jgi:PadR family transcriptional regulator, regulatory protein PadR
MPTEAPVALPKSFLRPCLLLLLREEPAHGYDLLERVQSLGFDGSDPGGLYRALRSLEKEKLVRSVWQPSENGPDRRTYAITRAGMQELHRCAKGIAGGQRMVSAFLSRYQEFVALPRGQRPASAPSRPKEAALR